MNPLSTNAAGVPLSINSASRQRAERFLAEEVRSFTDRLRELDSEIPRAAVPRRGDDHHRRVLEAFQRSQDACRRFEEANQQSPEMILGVQERFRDATDPWFRRSWIAHRARTKPTGFPGDFEMLIKLYDEQTPALGLGGYLDLCILDLPLARAVRARLAAAREFVVAEIAQRTGDVRVLDIACGPCREYRNWPDPGRSALGAPRAVEVVAMDSDPNAIEYVKASIAAELCSGVRLEPVRYNALRTRSAATTERKFGKFDILYSVGLCDYLSDAHLIAMLGAWRDTLKEAGVLYVAFKDTECYDKTPYQWHLDWFFYQRTRDDVLALFRQAGFDPNKVATTRDSTGIIINFVHRFPAQRITRTDAADRSLTRLDQTSDSAPHE